jgi:hypothetical protein
MIFYWPRLRAGCSQGTQVSRTDGDKVPEHEGADNLDSQHKGGDGFMGEGSRADELEFNHNLDENGFRLKCADF